MTATLHHPALPREKPLTEHNKCLEMRVYWGTHPVEIHHYSGAALPRLGETKTADVLVTAEGLPSDPFHLVARQGTGYYLNVSDAMAGEVELGGQLLSLSQARKTSGASHRGALEGTTNIRLGRSDRALLRLGGLAIALRFVPQPARSVRKWSAALDLPYLNALLVSGVVHIATVACLLLSPVTFDLLQPELFNQDERWLRWILDPPIALVVQEEPEALPPQQQIAAETVREQPTRLPDGAHPATSTSLSIKARREAEYRLTRQQMQHRFKDVFQEILGGGAGHDLRGVSGGSLGEMLRGIVLQAAQVPSALGDHSTSTRGLGPMQAGHGIGSIRGPGMIATRGRADGDADYGNDVSLRRRRGPAELVLESVSLQDALPRYIIQRVVQENRSQIRYCYERELQARQSLAGTVRVRWAISGTGKVVAVRVLENSLETDAVAQCLVERIRRWRFPRPAGGGVVIVNKPFVFRVTED